MNKGTTWITMLLGLLVSVGQYFGFELGNPDTIIDTISGGNITLIFMLVANWVTPITKIVKNWSWSFVKSRNFLAQSITAIWMTISVGWGDGIDITIILPSLINFLMHIFEGKAPAVV